MKPIINNSINERVDKLLLDENQRKEANHKSSGKLSASMLGYPLQWQILKTIGAQSPPFDAYTLRKFLRGRTVEDWLTSVLPSVEDTQVFCEYRNTIGYIDIITEITGEMLPHEVKSVTNLKFKYLEKRGEADDGHLLQACFYALAKNYDRFVVDYVASDDLRILSFVYKTRDFQEKVEKIIDNYEAAMKKKKVPVFTPLAVWHKNRKYNMFPDWMELNEEEIKAKMKRLKLLF